jgi:hypothetical protein
MLLIRLILRSFLFCVARTAPALLSSHANDSAAAGSVRSKRIPFPLASL